MITLNIKEVTVIENEHSADKVMLYVDFPSPMPKVSKQSLFLTFDAEYDTGADYVRKHFNIDPKIIKRT